MEIINSQLFQTKRWTRSIAGKDLIIETGKLAPQANASVTVRMGDTVILATATMKDDVSKSMGYFPLFVDYEERLYAAGKIKGSRFMKREGRPTDEAVVTSRVVDRSIRPNFPKGMMNEVQVIITVLSFDGEHDTDVLGIIGASAALSISNIPFGAPLGAVRVGMIDGQFVANPTYVQRETSKLDAVFAGTAQTMSMIEAGAHEVKEDDFVRAAEFAQKSLAEISALIAEMVKEIGSEKNAFAEPVENPEIIKAVDDLARQEITTILYGSNKKERNTALESLQKEITKTLVAKFSEDDAGTISDAFDAVTYSVMRKGILEKGIRIGGRKVDEVRQISCEVGLLPRTHGTGLFQRGETQVMTVCTLGAPGDEQTLDGLEPEKTKRFMHHYNFPPYSVGEVGPMRGPGRREIGHGALAERAIAPMIPQDREKFPYTIRLVSEALSSDGSTSMASTCGSTLALMDAGVHMKAPVSGIAMGLITEDKDPFGKYQVLSDIQDLEDFGGDMDFKVAGTTEGITAIQMDVKVSGITLDILRSIMTQSRPGRMHILDKMLATIEKPRADYSPFAPRITTLHINPEKIGVVIGPGGKMINEIIAATGVSIDIEDDGLVMISSANAEASARAIEWVNGLTREAKVGEKYRGKVTRLMNFGAFVEIFPGHEGLVHISQLADHRVAKVEDVVKVGDVVDVVVTEIDDQHRVNLSMKAAKR